MGEFDPFARTSACLCKMMPQLSRFIQENTKKNRQKAFLNKSYSHKSLYRPKKQTRIIFTVSRMTRELFEVNLSDLSAPPPVRTTFLQNFSKTIKENEKSVN